MLLLHLGKDRRNPQNGRDHSGYRLHLRRSCSCRTEDRPARRRRQDHTSAGRNAERSRPEFLRGSAGKTCGAFSQRRGRRSFRVKMKPGWELAFRPGFSFQQKWTIPHAVIRAQKPLWRRTVFLTIRGMRPGPAFAQHAPQYREQRRIYEQVDASNAPIFFLHNFPGYRSAILA